MIISDFIVSRFAEFPTIALNIFFLYRTLDVKIDKKKQIIAGIIFACVRITYYMAGYGVRPYFSVFSGLMYSCFVFSGAFSMHFIWNLTSVVLNGILNAFMIGLFPSLANTSSIQSELSNGDRIIAILVAKILVLTISYFITKDIDKSINLKWNDCIFLLLVPAGCWGILEILFKYAKVLPLSVAQPLMTVGGIVLAVIIVSVVELYNRLTANMKQLAHSKLQLRIVDKTKEHISEISEMYSRLSTLRHDLHNHFSVISGYIKTKEYDILEAYVANLTDEDMTISGFVKHPVLDTLISTRAKIAKQENIHFTANLELPETLPVSDVDLCILVGNILDNAFEANQQVSHSNYIHINTRIIDSYWVVACKNATKEKGNLRSFGSLKSAKGTASAHGIGTKQIQLIAEKTGGFVSYTHANYEFSVLALLKLPEVQSSDPTVS